MTEKSLKEHYINTYNIHLISITFDNINNLIIFCIIITMLSNICESMSLLPGN